MAKVGLPCGLSNQTTVREWRTLGRPCRGGPTHPTDYFFFNDFDIKFVGLLE